MESIAKNITEKRVFENGRIFVAPTGAKDVVTIEGSVLGGYNMLPRTSLEVPVLAARLFDAGTKAHGKDALRESLAARGASLSFSSGGDRTSFSGSCLPEDLPFLLQLIAECLGTAIFPTTELTTARERLLGRLKESKTDTRTQAADELSRLIYDPKHVNYSEKDAFIEKSVKAVTRKDLISFRSILGTGGLVLAIAGDVDPSAALKSAAKAFGTLTEGTLEESIKIRNRKLPEKQEKLISIPYKSNIDVYLGCALPITYDDELYMPFMVMTDMLGGGFASHLMQTIRERDGLTYGIYSTPTGFQKNVEGAFRILATFAPQIYEKGVMAVRKEMRTFFSTGLTPDSLDKKKDEMVGSYVIGLATTHGLASRLHTIGVRGRELSYIDEYLEQIRAVTVQDLKDAAALIPLDKLALAAAGTFAK